MNLEMTPNHEYLPIDASIQLLYALNKRRDVCLPTLLEKVENLAKGLNFPG